MPLPIEPATLTGGCSCGAIRYKIDMPEQSLRQNLPYLPTEAGVRRPNTLTCHCNDCRRHTGSPLPCLLFQVPAPMISVSVLSPSDTPKPSSAANVVTGRILDVLDEGYDAAKIEASRPPYRPAMDVLRAIEGSGASNDTGSTWLRFFYSLEAGENASRSFCGRCGTQVCFHFKLIPEYCHGGELPDGWADLFDIFVGTMDREFLEKDWLLPDSEVNFKCGTLVGRTVSASSKYLKGLPKSQGMGDEDVPKGEVDALALE
jgi:hypothetical protein